MFVKRFFEPLIAQNSYLIGCAAAGEAIVIDPNRDMPAVHRRGRARGAQDHARHRNAHPRRLPVGRSRTGAQDGRQSLSIR